MTLAAMTNHLNQSHHKSRQHHHHRPASGLSADTCDCACDCCAITMAASHGNNNNNNNNNNNSSIDIRDELTYQHEAVPEARLLQLDDCIKLTASTQRAPPTATAAATRAANLSDLPPGDGRQPPRRHKDSLASSLDPYSSLNMSSMGSSSTSSVQHSPLLASASQSPEGGCARDSFGLDVSSQLGRHICAAHSASDCSRPASVSCSPLSEGPPDPAALSGGGGARSPGRPGQRAREIKRLSTISDANLLHPNRQQKVRSFSHSNTFSPAAAVPAAAAGRHSSSAALADDKQPTGDAENDEPQQAQSLSVSARPRRLSRIEQRKSLLELGYGNIESYFKLQRLGKGTYATVYMGRSRLSNDLVALKEILKEHDEGAPCTAIREVSLLRLLRHNNIVTLHDICHTPKKLTLVFEYVGPDLYAYMKENNNLLSIHNVRLLLYQLLRGISFCHSRQVLHRDLKPQNLLINSRGELKICDFGLARAKSIPTKSYSNEVVTLWYRPPDVLLGNTDYDHSIDMWGVGCIFYEMASGRTFFPGSSVRQQLYLIFSSLGAPNQHNWPEILTNPDYQSYSFPSFRPEKLSHRVPRLDSTGITLLMSFLRFKPSERISAEEARRDPYFACLPEAVHHLSERESIFDVPNVYMTLNPGQKLSHRM